MTTVKPETAPGEPNAPKLRPAAVGQPTKSRRRLWVTALGIALVLIGGLATWYVTTATSQTVSVLTTSTSVERGDEITQDALTTISIAGGQGVDSYSAEEAAGLLGQVAAVDLPAGTMLTSTNVIDTLPVPDGQTIVGVSLTPAQLPAYPLVAGDAVRVVDTPVAQGEPPANDPKTFTATVFTTTFDDSAGTWVVDLIVPAEKAPAIAARAATQRVALILDSAPEGE